MTECRSTDLQDLLPDYVADTLDDVSAARVATHIATCATCADDVAVLQLVRRARPQVRVPDVARIVAALPSAPVAGAPLATGGQGRGGLRLLPDEHAGGMAASVPPSMNTQRTRGSVFGRSVFRLAATLGVVIAGGASVLVARRGISDLPSTATVVAMNGGDSVTGAPLLADPERAETVTVATATGRVDAVSVSYGDLGDYSEDELQRMLSMLDAWDGATNTEPLPGVPILPDSGGNTP